MVQLNINDFLRYPEPPKGSEKKQDSAKGHPALEDCILVSPTIRVFFFEFNMTVCQVLNYIMDQNGGVIGYIVMSDLGYADTFWTDVKKHYTISPTLPALPNSVDANFVCDIYHSYVVTDFGLEAIPLDFEFWGITAVYYSCNDIRQYVPLDVFIDKLYKRFINKNIELPNLCNDYRGIEDLFDGLN